MSAMSVLKDTHVEMLHDTVSYARYVWDMYLASYSLVIGTCGTAHAIPRHRRKEALAKKNPTLLRRQHE